MKLTYENIDNAIDRALGNTTRVYEELVEKAQSLSKKQEDEEAKKTPF